MAAPESTPPGTVAPPDVYDQLKKLGELREAGVLTPEEFEAKKTKLMEQV